jgi:hypothetical protein
MQLTWLFYFLFSLGKGRETRSGNGGTSSRIPINKISDNGIEMHMFAVATFPQIFSAFVRKVAKIIHAGSRVSFSAL